MGGRISIELGIRHADRVKALALLCPAMAFLKLRQFVPIVRFLRPELAVLPLRLPRPLIIRSIRSMFSKPDRLPRAWYEAGADEFIRIHRDVRARIALSASARGLYLDEPRGNNGFWSRLRALERPALFVWGERDVLVPSRFAHHVARAAPDTESIILEDCGHVPQFELPDQTHAHVLDFFERAA
jgi:pimeloyl-ACP methyl ester carboxylesterase